MKRRQLTAAIAAATAAPWSTPIVQSVLLPAHATTSAPIAPPVEPPVDKPADPPKCPPELIKPTKVSITLQKFPAGGVVRLLGGSLEIYRVKTVGGKSEQYTFETDRLEAGEDLELVFYAPKAPIVGRYFNDWYQPCETVIILKAEFSELEVIK